MEDKPKLVLLEGDQPARDIPLDPGECTMGRSRSCTIQIEDSEVSGKHAAIRVDGGEVWLKDCQSKNGTLLNEKPLRGEVSLAPGDVFRLGNTRFRFEAPVRAAEEPAPPPPPAPEGGETRFMALPREPGTRILESVAPAPPGREDGTAALPDNATRMLEASELKGLKAAPKAAWDFKKIAAGVAISILVLGGAVYFAMRPGAADVERPVGMEAYHDQDSAFEISLPENWSRSGKAESGVVTFAHADATGAKGQVDIRKDQNVEYDQTGLTGGFETVLEECRARYPEFALAGSKKMEVNDVMLLFYAFSSGAEQGKGIYLLNGDTRIVVEGHSARRDYPAFADLYSTILQGFKLYHGQKYFDFPLPDETIRKAALANPEQVAQQATERFKLGREYLQKRDVQLDNLYRSIHEFQSSLQRSYALSSRPAVYAQAAEELKYAHQLFDEAVRRQRFEINLAFKQGDLRTTYWEAHKLMQMIPNKTDPIYEEASWWVKRLSKKKR
jgi:hypothetical protein